MDEVTNAYVGIANSAADNAAAGFARFSDVGADRVFREPVHAGDHVVIVAASIEMAGGYGYGGGAGTSPDNGPGSGGGGGFGGRSEGRPVAVIDIGPDGVQVRPIVDVTRIGITVALSALAVWRVLRR